ncbi:MAG TPA: PD-(D/E)XK nuclease family protein [Methylophilus sp.]
MTVKAHSSIIVCATARLARSLQLNYQQQQIKNGATQWHAPAIMTLTEWLDSVIEAALLQGDINPTEAPVAALNPTQEGLLWEQAIQLSLKGNAAADLFDTSGLASAAMEANRLLIEWNLRLDPQSATEETQQFSLWRQRFQTLCKQTGYLEAVRYMAWQIACLQKGAGSLPAQLQLAGFDRIHPHLQRLIDVLKVCGVTVTNAQLTLTAPQALAHVVLDDQDAECRAAVAWAQHQLTENPARKLAIVVPELEALRAKLAYLLDDTFHPTAAAPAHAELTRCYDFSLGVPLANLPIIRTALDLLRLAWQKRQILQSDFARLLQSSYWSNIAQEADARAKLDARMRRELPLSIKPNRLLHYLNHAQSGDYALSIQHLFADSQQLMTLAQQQARMQTPALWATSFRQILAATHWPGDRALSSHEYQAMQSFERILQQLTGLDALLGKISAHEAIKRLTQLCQAQIFQPERDTPAAILVMGLLEASAAPLDAMWVMGMNDHIWPPVARPNALIPAELQRNARTPNASSEVQAAFAQVVHQRLIKSAQHVIFSSAAKDGERQLRVSPLMQAIPQTLSTNPTLNTLAEQLALASKQDWQWLDDWQAPPVLSGEHVSGGTALLKAQAICPAWAFYQYRLGARKLDEPVNGLDVMERGTLVHAVLAAFWRSHDAAALTASTGEALINTLHALANQVLTEFNNQSEHAFSDTFLALEAERLSKLVWAWLTEVEMQRPQGFSVLACEAEHKITIEDISIKLVIDRIDQLDDGRLVVMDYKTGRQMDYKNWAAEAITEPQLPIYAAFVLQELAVAAVCYAKVRPADFAFIGIAESEDMLQGATVLSDKRGRTVFDEAQFPDWPSVLQHWHTRITATALALKAGDAAMRFSDEKQLDYCEVLPLLRLPERQLQFERQQSMSTQSAQVSGEPR